MSYIGEVVISETTKHLSVQTSIQEFVVWLGCLFYMGCYQGITDRRLWWSVEQVDMKKGAPFCLGPYMSRFHWEAINGALRYTNKIPPAYVDRFHEVRQMQDNFNTYYAEQYCPGWWNCLDESMSVWQNNFCPGFMCVPRKPHPFGNEYHSICDGDLNGAGGGNPIMWHAEIQEGKDQPAEFGAKKYDEKGKTVGLMCRILEPI